MGWRGRGRDARHPPGGRGRGPAPAQSFFGVGAPEALVIGVVAMVLFGPKGLADAVKSVGGLLREFQPTLQELNDISQEFKSTLEDEIGLDEIKQELAPIQEIRDELSGRPRPRAVPAAPPAQDSSPGEAGDNLEEGGVEAEDIEAMRAASAAAAWAGSSGAEPGEPAEAPAAVAAAAAGGGEAGLQGASLAELQAELQRRQEEEEGGGASEEG